MLHNYSIHLELESRALEQLLPHQTRVRNKAGAVECTLESIHPYGSLQQAEVRLDAAA